MSAIQLKEGVWSVGVLNPALRVFDIVMEAKYGTSYNAYLVTGEKNVLIETVHAEYFQEYVDNITSVIPLEQIDYLIMNHNEPDHSGSVAMLMERCPNLKIFATAAGKKHMEDVANRALPIQIVKAGDTLDLGDGKVLEFIPAPMLHWADSMFTWDPADKVAFTCDFLGCHFCEPTMLDKNMHDIAAYEGEFYNYYGGIFSPFKPFVLKGLSLLPAEAEMVCPSHGPVLVERLQWAKDEYRRLSTVAPKAVKDAAVIYASAYGCTKALAEAAAEALKADGLNVTCLDLVTAGLPACVAAANEADVLLVGAPTINRDAPKGIWDVVTSIDAINVKGKAAGAFGSFGWSGEAPGMLHTRLGQLKYAIPEAPFRVTFTPTDDDKNAMADYARSVAALCK